MSVEFMDDAEEMREYLGDGVYASFDGWYVWLTTSTGQRVALDMSTYRALLGYVDRLTDCD